MLVCVCFLVTIHTLSLSLSHPVPEIFLVPFGDISIPAGASFTFDCLVTFKIPPLPTEVLLNGQPNELSQIIPDGEPVSLHPFLRQPFIFQNLSTIDNGTLVQCATIFSMPDVQQLSITSDQAKLLVFRECSTI